MLTRFALIIGYPGEINGENYCEGVLTDVKRFEAFLQSPSGGAWESEEIHSVLNIQKDNLEKWLNFISGFDYSIVYFAGHGEYNSFLDQTEIEINSNETFLENNLILNCDRQLIILDCCRKKTPILIQDSIQSWNFSYEDYSPDLRDLYKRKFDELLNQSVRDLIQVYSCDIDETAHDLGEKGGLFSKKLLDSAAGPNILTIGQTFNIAKPKIVTASRGKQNPQIAKPRSGTSFPFYIS